MRIIHSDGVWPVNKCQFQMVDRTQDVRPEPGELTCVKFSGWLKMQTAPWVPVTSIKESV